MEEARSIFGQGMSGQAITYREYSIYNASCKRNKEHQWLKSNKRFDQPQGQVPIGYFLILPEQR